MLFENLQTSSADRSVCITHEHGPLLQEDHYYPYGMGMAGISSGRLPAHVPNRYQANAGAELGYGEWADGSGLELYETFYRSYSAQIGRFMQVDPLAELAVTDGGYVYGGNNPVRFTDYLGDRYSYMDARGSRWHHRDFMAGTGAAGTSFVAGWGMDGFGNQSSFANGFCGGGGGGSFNSDYSDYWEDLIASVPTGENITFGTSFDPERPYTYVNLTGAFNSRSYEGYETNYVGQQFFLTFFRGESFEYKSWGERALDGFQTGLDIVGLVPGIGEIADGLNAAIYLGRGDYVNAGLSAAAMVPFAGWAATGGKFAKRIGRGSGNAFRYVSEGEIAAIRNTGFLRGGRAGETYYTKDLYKSRIKALQKLSLGSTPTHRIEFEILNSPTLLKNGTKVSPIPGQPGLGSEFMTIDPVRIRLINVQPLR